MTKISFNFNVGDKVRIVEAGHKNYGKEDRVSDLLGSGILCKYYLVLHCQWIEGWKLEKV